MQQLPAAEVVGATTGEAESEQEEEEEASGVVMMGGGGGEVRGEGEDRRVCSLVRLLWVEATAGACMRERLNEGRLSLL